MLERGIPELIKDVEGGKLDVFAAAYLASRIKRDAPALAKRGTNLASRERRITVG